MDVGYTVMCVALLLAVMGHVLFGDFEVTMITLPDSISGWCTAHVKLLMITHFATRTRACECACKCLLLAFQLRDLSEVAYPLSGITCTVK